MRSNYTVNQIEHRDKATTKYRVIYPAIIFSREAKSDTQFAFIRTWKFLMRYPG